MGKFGVYVVKNVLVMYNPDRKSFFLKIIIVGILFLVSGCHSSLNTDIQVEIDGIVARWAPDSREGICRITAGIDKAGTIILHGETSIPEAKKEIIKTLSKPGIELIDSIIVLPDTLGDNKYRGLLTLSVVNLRKEPDHQSELVSQAILGTPVVILKNYNSWLLIQTPDRYIAWTERSSVVSLDRIEMENWKKSDRIIYLENAGWIFSSPDENQVVGDMVAGCILEKTGESKDYIKIILPDRREGFVRKEAVIDFNIWRDQSLCNEDNICRQANTYLGLPYLWGGSSSKAVDCSGFVQEVYFMNGRVISRDASLQAGHGDEVDISDVCSQLERGDLLFFGSQDESKYHVTHVAIYRGDSEYIHASGRVMVNSLDSTRNNYSSSRKNSLLFVRRFIGVENDLGIVPLNMHEWY